MSKKNNFDEERTAIPEVWKLIVVLVASIGMLIIANKVTDAVYEKEMMQSQAEYVHVGDSLARKL